MGVCHVLHALDPDVVQDAARAPMITLADARAFLARHGVDDPAARGFDQWADAAWLDEVAAVDAAYLGRLALLTCASRRTWDLDKAPTHGFLTLFARAPELAPVAALFMGEGWLPETLVGEDEGLVTILRQAEIQAARIAIAPWIVDDARARIASLSGGFVARTFGGDRKHAAEWRNSDDYTWGAWRKVGAALSACDDEGRWLGVEMG